MKITIFLTMLVIGFILSLSSVIAISQADLEQGIRDKLVEYWRFEGDATGEKGAYDLNVSGIDYDSAGGKFGSQMACINHDDDIIKLEIDSPLSNFTLCAFYNYSTDLQDNKIILAMTTTTPGSNYYMYYTQPDTNNGDNTYYTGGATKGRTQKSNPFDKGGFTFICQGVQLGGDTDLVMAYTNETYQTDTGSMSGLSAFDPMYFAIGGSDRVYNPAGGAYRAGDGCYDEAFLFNDVLAEQELSFLRNLTEAFDPVGATIISNSSFEAISNNVIGNTTEWNVGGVVNITSNLLTFNFTTSQNANASCSIGNDVNYSTMIALPNGSNYKLATTDTVSHSYTLYDNISLGSNCLYCSYIASDGTGENADAHSGCLEIVRSNVPTAIQSIGFNITDVAFSSSDFVTLTSQLFNTSKTEDLIILNSLNAEKISAGGSNDINLRVSIDGSVLKNEVVRTVSTVGDVGSTGLSPTKTSVAVGEHNITLEASRTGAGSINISNIDLILMIASTGNDNQTIKVNISDISASHSTNTYEEAFNWTMDKIITSENFLFWKITATKSTTGNADISYLMRDEDADLSPIASRLLSGSGDTGSLAMCFIDEEESSDHDHTLLAKNTDTDDTIIINGSIFDMDLRDNSSHYIRHFSESDPATNDTTTSTYGAGTHVLTNGSLVVGQGNSVIVTASVTAQSTTGTQTPRFFITVGSETVQKYRYLSGNTDIGNIFFHKQFNHLTNGSNFTASLQVEIGAGESLDIRDESITGFEAITFDIASVGNPPLSNPITAPDNGSSVIGVTPITWIAFSDPDGNGDNCSVDLYDDNFVFNESIENTTFVDTSSSFNFSSVNDDYYRLVVQCFDDTGFDANSSIRVQAVSLDPIDVNLSTPLNDSTINSSLSVDFSYFVNFDTTCSLQLNSTLNESMSASAGANTFPTITLENFTYSWKVNCSNATLSADSEDFILNMKLLVFEDPARQPDDFGVGQCPDTTPKALLFAIMIGIIVLLIVYSEMIRMMLLNFIAVMMIFVTSWFIVGCSAFFGMLLALAGVGLLVRGIVISFSD